MPTLASLAPATLAAQALHAIDPETRALVPPIHTATTYARDAAYQLVGPGYTRDENPTYRTAEALLARLEGGDEALLFSSGMAAATTALHAVLAPGDRLVASRAMYFGLRAWLEGWCARWQVELRLVDATDLGAVREALGGRARMLWIETPANPTWDVVDIAACADLAHAAGALLGVDSTVATPVHTRPLGLGADLVMHSAPSWKAIRALRHDQGAVLGPFEAFLLLRGMRTLYLRVPRRSANALAVAERLHGHPKLEAVIYPGLPSHPGHEVARRQMAGGFGGMLSLRVRGGAEAATALVSRLELWLPATSLGGVESLVEHRATA